MRRLEVGSIVFMRKSIADWYLQYAAEVMIRPSGELDPTFDDCVRIMLTRALGEPVFGEVTGFGSTNHEDEFRRPYVKVKWRLGEWRYEHYFSNEDII